MTLPTRPSSRRRSWMSVAGLFALLSCLLSPVLALAQEGTPGSLLPPAAPASVAPAPARTVEVAEDEVVRGDPSRPRISLIINIGAGFETAGSMLDTLKEKGVTTTFFVLGWWAEREPGASILKRIADDGHEVASHGHSVYDLTVVSDAAVRDDLERADAVISGITGKTTRPLWSASAGNRDARVHRVVASMGYRPIYLTVDSWDWMYDATADSVYGHVMDRASNGAIILTHFDSPTTVRSTAVALPRLIDDLRARGYELVTITDLLTQ